MRLWPYVYISCLFLGCSPSRYELEEQGYQVFEQFGLAIKTPCELSIDSTVVLDSPFSGAVVMACPQIFADTSREAFYPGKLLESDGYIYHLKIYKLNERRTSNEQIALQKEILTSMAISDYDDIEVSGQKGLQYEIPLYHVSEAWITYYNLNFLIGVMGDSSKQKLNAMLKEVRIGRFSE